MSSSDANTNPESTDPHFFRELYNSGFVLSSDELVIVKVRRNYKPGNFFVSFRIRTVLPLR